MDDFLEQLLNAIYQKGQKILTYFFGVSYHRSSSIKFGGFLPSYNWYGKTSLKFDKVGSIEFSTKTIYLNLCFLHHYLGLIDWQLYDFPKFVNSMAHEITHCLIADYSPKKASEHDDWFYLITYFIETHLWETTEIRVLASLSGSNRSFSRSLQ